ncbi:Methyl-CpG-binding domain-containing protein 7 [Linum perenne]
MTLNITVKTPSLNYPTPQNPERKIPSQSAMERPSSSRISVQIPKLSSDSSSNSMQLQFQAHDLSALSQIVPLDQIICSTPASASSPDGFQLPEGWIVQKRRRRLPSFGGSPVFDKYYIEPHTGRRFRSLPDVHRYLKEDEGYVGTPMAIKSRHDQNNMQVVPSAYDDGSQLGLPLGWFVELRPRSDPSKFDKMQTVPSAFKSGSQFNLPCDWLVELRPRSDGSRLDRYYIEPGTGRKFRSLVAAQKQVEEAEELRTGLKASTPMVYTTVSVKYVFPYVVTYSLVL